MSEKQAPAPRPDMRQLVCALRNRAIEQGIESEREAGNDRIYGLAWEKTNAAENELWGAIMDLEKQYDETQRGRDALQALWQNQLESIASLQKELKSLKASLGNDSDSTEGKAPNASKDASILRWLAESDTVLEAIYDAKTFALTGWYAAHRNAPAVVERTKIEAILGEIELDNVVCPRSRKDAESLSNVITPSPKTPEQVEAEDQKAWREYCLEMGYSTIAFRKSFLAGRASLRNQGTAG